QVIDNIRATVDAYVASRVNSAYALSANKSLKILAARAEENPEEMRAACQEIYNHCRSLQTFGSFISLTAVYMPERNLVISARNVQITADTFYKQSIGFVDSDAQTFYDHIQSTQAGRYYPTTLSQTTLGAAQWLMLYVQPIDLGYLRCRAYFISLIDRDSLFDLFVKNLDEQVHFQLYDSAGTVLMRSDGFPGAWQIPRQGQPNNWTETSQGHRYHAFASRSGLSDLNYVFYVPEWLVLKRLTAFQRIWVGVTALCLTIGVFLARLIARRLHQPFQALLRQAFPEGLTTDTRSLQQEYSMVAARMRETQIINQQFQREISSYYQSMRDTMLLKLLTQSRYLVDEELSEAADLCGLPSERHAYQVLFVEGRDAAERKGPLISHELLEGSPGGLVLCYTELAVGKYVIVIALPSQQALNMEALVAALFPPPSGLRIGFRQLQRGLTEASASCMRHETGPYLTYDELLTDASALYYPVDKELQILAAARSGNYEETRQLLGDLYDYNLRERRLVPEMLMSLYNNMITTAIKASEQLPEGQAELYERSLRMLSTMNLQNASTDQIFTDVLSLYRNLCALAQRSIQSKNKHIMENVVDYMEQNYANPNLCLDVIADNFRVSYYFLSRIFKEETHQSFSDLLNDIRIRHAIELLGASSQAVQAVAELVGYANMSTFLRAFKKRTGTTPLQYRKQ
ncbi:MAG TPA: helix-turn-helix domain-containing protein, partial [Clostridia bacterium]|nr:helix-turn-helix domain-containing protein [Clostridia bacterium]